MKKDITRKAVETFQTVLERAIDQMGTIVPYGPSTVAVTPKELARKLEQLGPDGRANLATRIGENEMLELMRQAQNGKAS